MKLILILVIFLLAINSWAATPVERAQDITTMKPLSAKPSTPPTGAKLYYKDSKLRVLESSGVEKALGSADLQGNFFLNGGFEYGSTVGWTGPVTATTAQTRAGDWAGLISTTSATMSVTATITLPEGYAAGTDVKVGIDLKTDLADNVVYFCGLADTTETSCTPMTGNVYKRIETSVTVPTSRVVGFKIKTLTAVTTSATYADKGYIGEWNIGKVSNVNFESVSYSGYTSKDASNRAKFTSKNSTLSSNGVTLADDNSGAFTKKISLKKCFVTSILSWYSPTTTTTFYINHYDASGNLLSASSTGKAASLYQTTPYTAKMEKGDYLAVITPDAATAPFVWTTNAQSVSDDVVTSANAPRSYNLAITGTNWTTYLATGVYYRSGNSHRLKFNINGATTSGSRSNYSVSVAGVTFKSATYDHLITGGSSAAVSVYSAFATQNGSTLTAYHSTGTTANYGFTGDIELESKPTWADDVSTQYSAVIPRNQVAYLKDVKSPGVGGGTATAGAWYQRDLNTAHGDTSIVSLTNNQFVLQAGLYDIDFYGVFEKTSQSSSCIWDVAAGACVDSLIGSGEYSSETSYYATVKSSGSGSINLTAAKTFELRYRVQTTLANYGLGNNAQNGSPSIFAMVKITKLDRN